MKFFTCLSWVNSYPYCAPPSILIISPPSSSSFPSSLSELIEAPKPLLLPCYRASLEEEHEVYKEDEDVEQKQDKVHTCRREQEEEHASQALILPRLGTLQLSAMDYMVQK